MTGRRSRATAPRLRVALAAASVALFSPVLEASPAQDYMLYCMGCHGTRAEGVPGKIPPLANNLVRFMRSPAGRNYVLRVPGAASSALPDAQLAAVLNWVAETFDSSASSRRASPFTAEEVTRSRHSPLVSVSATRAAVVKSLAATGTAPPLTY